MFLHRWFRSSFPASPRQPKQQSRRQVVKRRLAIEDLETRSLLTVTSFHLLNHAVAPSDSPSDQGKTPAQIRSAYGFNNLTFGSIAADGTGQTIAIIDAYDDPNIRSDLAVFDATFGISPPPSFQIVNQYGGSALPGTDPNSGPDGDWEMETTLDVEWAHAIAPGANILLVEANSATYSDLFGAVNWARSQPGVSVISMSWGSQDSYEQQPLDTTINAQIFVTPLGHQGVTFVVSSGDDGFPSTPASFPNALGVGGTSLTLTSSNQIASESAWGPAQIGDPINGAGGGGISQEFANRKVPDVSYNADLATGFNVYDTFGYQTGWIVVGGTSAGAPQWSSLVAIANQGRTLAGKGTLDGPSQTLPGIYSAPSSAMHDVTTGNNGYEAAGVGYDLATGIGTPAADQLIPYLVNFNGVNNSPPTSGTISTPPNAPINFGGSALSASQISLSWLPAAGATGYSLYEFENGQPIQIAAYNSGTTSATVSNLSGGTTYAFNLVAYNAHGTAATPWIGATTLPALSAAQNLHATSVSSSQVSVSWTPSSAAIGYSLYAYESGRPVLVASYGAGTTTATITGLAAGTTYPLNLVAYNAAGSAATPWVAVSTSSAAALAPVQNLQATPTSSTTVQLSWAASIGATGYTVYMWQNGAAVPVITLGAGATSTTIGGLTAGSTAHFAIAALSGRTSANSNWVSATLPASGASSSAVLAFWLGA